MDTLIGYSANKMKNTEAKKLSKYHGSKRSKADIIPLFKERKRNPVRHSIDSWNKIAGSAKGQKGDT